MEEERHLKIVKSEDTLTADEIDNLIPSKGIDYDILANKVASKVNTQMINDELKKYSDKIDTLSDGIANLVNEIKKQSVDENNSSLKIARTNGNANITINSLDYHIAHVISFTHIAACYHLVTDKDATKVSYNKARKLLVDLNLLEDENYVSKVLNGSKTITKKYHFTILSEIKKRLLSHNSYGITPEISEKWRRVALIPEDSEIKNKIDEVFALFD